MKRLLVLTAALALVTPVAMRAQAHSSTHPPQGSSHGQAGHDQIDPKLHAAMHGLAGDWKGSTQAADGASKKFSLTLEHDNTGQLVLTMTTDLPIKLGAAKEIAFEGNTIQWTQDVAGSPCKATAVVTAATAQTPDTMNGSLACATGSIAFAVQKSKG